jgi:hypothetical protein
MSAAKARPPQGIPLIVLMKDGRNVRMAVKDPTTPPALRAELERYLADPFHAAAVDQEAREKQLTALLDSAEATAAPYRKGGAKGRQNAATKAVRDHIRELLGKHKKLSPPQLYDKADPNIIGDMAKKTFCNHVRFVREK